MNPLPLGLRVAGVLALLFGAMTLAKGGRMLRTPVDQRPHGVVPWVLGFNVAAGAFYLLAGAGSLAGQAWSLPLAWALAGSTLLVYAAFLVHVLRGGAYMRKTFVAMALRSGFWLAQAWALSRWLPRS